MNSFILLKERVGETLPESALRQDLMAALEKAHNLQIKCLRIERAAAIDRQESAERLRDLEAARESIDGLWAANTDLRAELETTYAKLASLEPVGSDWAV